MWNLSSFIFFEKDEVGAKIKEIRDDTYFCEVVSSGFDLINYNMQQLEEVEFHLQKYSVQPITNNPPRVLSRNDFVLILKIRFDSELAMLT